MVANAFVILAGGFLFGGDVDRQPGDPLPLPIDTRKDKQSIPPPPPGYGRSGWDHGPRPIPAPPPPDAPILVPSYPGDPMLRDHEKLVPPKVEGTERPVGTWKREIGNGHLTVRFEHDRLFGKFRLLGDEDTVTLDLEADYSVTKDSVLYGVISSIEIKGGTVDVAEARANALKFIDQPFSIRFRVDDGVLTVKDMKMGGIGLRDSAMEREELLLAAIVGRYTAATGQRTTSYRKPLLK